MLAAAVAVLVLGAPERAETATAAISTATGALSLDELPLSEEDLALIAAITADRPITATIAPTRPEPLLALHLDRDRLRAVVPRSLGEALITEPSALVVRRHHVTGDDVLVRGRGGTRPQLRLDGLSLDHALTRFDDRDALGLVDPWMLDRLSVEDRDQITLSTLRPSGELHSYGALHARSADRSSGFVGQVEGGLGPLGLLIAGRYDDYGRLRTDAQHDAAPWPYQRAGLHARARLWGGDDDPIDLVLGADLDRLTNVEDRLHRDELRLQHAAFAELSIHAEALEVQLVGGVRQLEIERDARARFKHSEVLSVESRGRATYAWGPLSVGVGGGVLSSRAQNNGLQQAEGGTRSLEGALLVTVASAALEAEAEIGVRDETTELAGATTRATGVVTRGRVVLRPVEALAIAGTWRYDQRLPSMGDVLALGALAALPERALLVELGPSFAVSTVELGLVGYARWIERALEPIPGGAATYVEGAWVGGVESRVAWHPSDALTITGAVGWTASDRVLAGIPGIVASASARWAADDWWVELVGRGLAATGPASPAEAPPPNTLSIVDRGEWSGALLGARGGVEIGAGFALALALENAFDVRTRGYGAAINDPGVDLRASLHHRW